MDDDVHVIEQDPCIGAVSLDVADGHALLVHLVLDVVGEGLDVGGRATGRDDHIIGKRRDVGDLDDADVQTLAAV